VRRPAKPTGSTSAARLADTLGAVRSSIDGCFHEWAERTGASDASLVVALTVTPDGIGSTPTIVSTPDTHPATGDGVAAKSVLEYCASEQIAKARFPPSSELLDVEVTAQWSPGQVVLTPRITSRRQGPHRPIELP
jgi:hypothetical protein